MPVSKKLITSQIIANIFPLSHDPIACKDHLPGGEENSRSLKGSAYNAVHLRTFGSRYHQTHNPVSMMKVSRCYFTGYLHNKAEHAQPHTNRYRFNRYNIHLHVAFITINVPKTARRHLCLSAAITK
ncbi:hypothetical protein [Photorhabdus sp. RM157S]|uniref:hypothetical protein n=1 Tax=Photorhabdus sp. RM157S TaxID=3342827 RepID=UPI0013012B7B